MKYLWNYLTIVFVLLLHATVLLGVIKQKRLLGEGALGIINVAGVIDDYIGPDYINTQTITSRYTPRADVIMASIIGTAVIYVSLCMAPTAVGLYKRNKKAVSGGSILFLISALLLYKSRTIMEAVKIPTITHLSLSKKTNIKDDDQYHCKFSYHHHHWSGDSCVETTFSYRAYLDEKAQRLGSTARNIVVFSTTPCCSKSVTEDILSLTDHWKNPIYRKRSTTGDTQAAISDDMKIVVQAWIEESWRFPFMYQTKISIHEGSKAGYSIQSLYLRNQSKQSRSLHNQSKQSRSLHNQSNIQTKLKSFAIVGTTAALMFLGNRNKK